MTFVKKTALPAGALVLTLALALQLGAEEISKDIPQPKTVTIEEAVNLAMQNNIQLASTAIDLRIKQRASGQAWNVFVPNVQATGTLARSNRVSNPYAPLIKMMNPSYQEADATEKDHWTAMTGLTMNLNLNLALFEGLKATRQNYESGRLTYEQALAETETNVRKAFYGILVQEESLKIAKDKLATSEERLAQTKANYKNGIVPELSVLQTQLSVETQKPAIKESEIGLELAKNQFAFLIGLPVGTKLELSGSIDPKISQYDADALVKKYLGNSYDIALLRLNGDMLRTQVRATRFQIFTPSISLNQSWSPVLSAIDDKWTDKSNWTDSSGAFSVTVAFNLTNLLPFTSTGQSLAEQKDNVKKIDLAMKASLYNDELTIRNLVDRLDKSRSSIQAMELSVSIAEKAYALTEQGYRAGTIEYLDLKDAETSLLQARMGVLAEKFTYLSTVLDLEKILNAKLD
jgi:outer membrane protein TolC